MENQNESFWSRVTKQQRIISGILLVIALISFFILPQFAPSIGNYEHTIASIDEKMLSVEKLTGATMGASTALSVIPGDACTPIANELAEFADDFLLILTILFAEKYFMSIIGDFALRIIIPLACAIGIAAVLTSSGKGIRIALKVGFVGIVAFFLIPKSIALSDSIYRIYEGTLNSTINEIETLEADATDAINDSESTNWFKNLWSKIGGSIKDFRDNATAAINNTIQAIAVMFVVSCGVPLLTLFFSLWLIKVVLNVDIKFENPRWFSKGRRKFKERIE